jgi:hypothetical protein
MKNIYLLACCLFLVLCVSCNRAQYFVGVGYPREPYEINYKSFNCIDVQNAFPDSMSLKNETVITEINSQMTLRGYQNAPEKPELIIFYVLFPDNVNLTVMRRSLRDFRGTDFNEELNKIRLKKGTLLVQLIDNYTNKPVWMGYAAGLATPTGRIDEEGVRVATRRIFDYFRYTAIGYVAKNDKPSSGVSSEIIKMKDGREIIIAGIDMTDSQTDTPKNSK